MAIAVGPLPEYPKQPNRLKSKLGSLFNRLAISQKLAFITFLLVFAGIGSYTLFSSNADSTSCVQPQSGALSTQHFGVNNFGGAADSVLGVPCSNGLGYGRFSAIEGGDPDNAVSHLAQAGLRFFPVLGLPCPANQPKCPESYSPDPTTAASEMAQYVAAFAQKYGVNGSFWKSNPGLPYLPINDFEIGNEPNLPIQFIGDSTHLHWTDPRDYAQVYEAARSALHSVDPSAVAVVGGLADSNVPGVDIATVEQWLAALISQPVDAIGYHPYVSTSCGSPVPNPSFCLSVLEGDTSQLRSYLNQNGFGSIPIDPDEFDACTTTPYNSTQRTEPPCGQTWTYSQWGTDVASYTKWALCTPGTGVNTIIPEWWGDSGGADSNTLLAFVDAEHNITPYGQDFMNLTRQLTTFGCNGPPPLSVAITSPANNATVNGTITIAASPTDQASLTPSVQFKFDGSNLSGVINHPPYSLSFDTTKVSNGHHTIGVVATDSANHSATTSEGVNINNVAPPVFSCNELSLSTSQNRTATVNSFSTTAQNGANFSFADISWGDGQTSNNLNPVVGKSHQYSQDGSYTVVATAHFNVNGQDESSSSSGCTATVKISTTPPPVFSCDELDVATEANRTVKITGFQETAEHGATYKYAVVIWGDNNPNLTSANPVGQTHQYGSDGSYIVQAIAHFSVNGQSQIATSAGCTKVVSVSSPKAPIYTCNILDVTPQANQQADISNYQVTAANGATYLRTDIRWGDGNTSKGLTTVVGQTHKYSKSGSYSVAAVTYFLVNGQTKSVTGANCQKTINVAQTAQPVYNCDELSVKAADNNSVSITSFQTSSANGAVYKTASIDWGDKTTPLSIVSPVGQTHQYSGYGTYAIVATAHFTINGQGDFPVSSTNCDQIVTFQPGQPPQVETPQSMQELRLVEAASPNSPTEMSPSSLISSGIAISTGNNGAGPTPQSTPQTPLTPEQVAHQQLTKQTYKAAATSIVLILIILAPAILL